MYEELFYKRLVELRLNKGVSARDMSLSIGQSAGYINALENKKGMPSLTVLFYICEYLDVTPSEFFDEGNGYPSDLNEIVEDLRHLNRSYLQSIGSIIKGLRRYPLISSAAALLVVVASSLSQLADVHPHLIA